MRGASWGRLSGHAPSNPRKDAASAGILQAVSTLAARVELEREELTWQLLGELKRRRDVILEAERDRAWSDLERLLWRREVQRRSWCRAEAVSWMTRRRRVARKRRRWVRADARRRERVRVAARERKRAERRRRAGMTPIPFRCGTCCPPLCGVGPDGVSYCGCGRDYLLQPLELVEVASEAAA